MSGIGDRPAGGYGVRRGPDPEVPAPVRLFREQAGALKSPMLERELRGRTKLGLEFLEAWKGLQEQLMHTFTAIGVV